MAQINYQIFHLPILSLFMFGLGLPAFVLLLLFMLLKKSELLLYLIVLLFCLDFAIFLRAYA